MDLSDTVMIGGICLAIAGCAMLLRSQVIKAQSADLSAHQPDRSRRGEPLDVYMAIVWSGFLLVQLANLAHHIQGDGTIQLSWLSLAAVAGDILVCGAFAGRLLLRREMRGDEEKQATLDSTAV